MSQEWTVWRREWFRYKVALCTYSNWAGGYYKFARDKNGKVLRFWSRSSALAYAYGLNEGATLQ